MEICLHIPTGKAASQNFYVDPVIAGLKLAASEYGHRFKTIGFDGRWQEQLPWVITKDGKPAAYIIYADYPTYTDDMRATIDTHNIKLIFRYQYDTEIDHPPGAISAGYVYPPTDESIFPGVYLMRDSVRQIDVCARMKDWIGHKNSPGKDWPLIRKRIVSQANDLRVEGYNTITDPVHGRQYYTDLINTKIGYNWRGFGMINFKLIEYFRCGVVPISMPYGPRFPIRDDIVLQDGIHYVECSNPANFADVTRKLLADPDKIAYIRNNVLDLWRDKLCHKEMGRWYLEKILAA